jgi:hypothetical protein
MDIATDLPSARADASSRRHSPRLKPAPPSGSSISDASEALERSVQIRLEAAETRERARRMREDNAARRQRLDTAGDQLRKFRRDELA